MVRVAFEESASVTTERYLEVLRGFWKELKALNFSLMSTSYGSNKMEPWLPYLPYIQRLAQASLWEAGGQPED